MRKTLKAAFLTAALIVTATGTLMADDGPSSCPSNLVGTGSANNGVQYGISGTSTTTASDGHNWGVTSPAGGASYGATGTSNTYESGTYTGNDGSKITVNCATLEVTNVIQGCQTFCGSGGGTNW